MPQRKALKKSDATLDQGDLLADVPFLRWRNGEAEFGSKHRGVVTSNGCTCEDYERYVEAGKSSAAARVFIQVAPLRPALQYPEKQQEEARAGEQQDYFYVFGEGTVLKDQVADLTLEQPFPAALLLDCKKIARLEDWQWKRLLIHTAVSRFHQEPETLFLPDVVAEAAGAA